MSMMKANAFDYIEANKMQKWVWQLSIRFLAVKDLIEGNKVLSRTAYTKKQIK